MGSLRPRVLLNELALSLRDAAVILPPLMARANPPEKTAASTTPTSEPNGAETMPLEKILERLGQVVEKLERGELPLEQSLAMFEEGIRLTREGQRRLDAAEQRIDTLLSVDGGNGEPVTEPTR